MQIYKKTRLGLFGSVGKLIIKIFIVTLLIFIVIILLNKINFPSPNKIIEKKIPNENFKIIK